MNIKTMQVGPLGTNCYLLEDEHTRAAAVIDPGGDGAQIEAQLLADAKEPALKQVRMDLAMAAIIKEENIDATDEEVEAEFQRMADQYGMDLETVKKYLQAEQVKDQLKSQKAIAVVVDSATAVKAEKKPAKKTAKKAEDAEGEEAAEEKPAKKTTRKKADEDGEEKKPAKKATKKAAAKKEEETPAESK